MALSDLIPKPAVEKHFVYRMFDDQGVLLYVGVSNNVEARLRSHAADRSKDWTAHVARYEVEEYPNRVSALGAESRAIQEEEPLHNRAGASARRQAEHQAKREEEERHRLEAQKLERQEARKWLEQRDKNLPQWNAKVFYSEETGEYIVGEFYEGLSRVICVAPSEETAYLVRDSLVEFWLSNNYEVACNQFGKLSRPEQLTDPAKSIALQMYDMKIELIDETENSGY